ncbi:MAG: hypothetical protein IT381_04415 [Deltaproteobacteria bacterium]|nr:hypothetical protein [Deltaproteobacteria bacterium]
MAVTIGPKDQAPGRTLQDVPSGAPNEEARADAKKEFEKEEAKRKERIAGKDQQPVTLSGKGAALAAERAKDVLATGTPAALLEALIATVVTKAPDEPPRASDALATFEVVKGHMGKPNDLPVPEAFAHDELLALAAPPAGFSAQATAFAEIAAKLRDGQAPPKELAGFFEDVSTTTRTQDLSDASARTKQLVNLVKRWQAVSEKMLALQVAPPAPPTAPAAIAQVLEKNWPQLAAIGKQLASAEANPKSSDIEIPAPAIVAMEKVAEEVMGAFGELVGELQKIAASPETHAAFSAELARAESGEQAESMRFSATMESWLPVRVAPQLAKPAKRKTLDLSNLNLGLMKSFWERMPKTPAPGEVKTFEFGGGFNLATADLESAIYYIMMQSAETENAIMRDKLKDMQETMKKRQAMREKITHMKAERLEAEKDMREEYDYLVKQGAIDESYTFDMYKAWRQITYTPDGDAALEQPMPPLPDEAVYGLDGPMGDFAPVGHPSYPADSEMVKDVAERYGLSLTDAAWMISFFNYLKSPACETMGYRLGPETTIDYFLTQRAGMTEGNADHNKLCVNEQQAWILGNCPTFAAGAPPTSATAGVTAEQYNAISQQSTNTLCDKLIEALSQEPLASNPDVIAFIEQVKASTGKSNLKDAIKAGLKAMQSHNNPNLTLLDCMAKLANAVQTALPAAGIAFSALMVLETRYGIDDSAIEHGQTTVPAEFVAAIGGDPSSLNGWGAQPCTTDFYNDNKPDSEDDYWRIGQMIYDMLATQEPFKSNGQLQTMIQNIAGFMGENGSGGGVMTQFIAFLGGDDTAFNNDDNMQMMVDLVNLVNGIAPGSKAMGLLMGLQAHSDPENSKEEWEGQAIFYSSFVLQIAEAEKEEKPDPPEIPPDATPEEGAAPTVNEMWEAEREQQAEHERLQEEERQDAEEAQRLAQGLSGEGLEDVTGARTGGFADFGVEIERAENERDSLGELSEQQQMHMQIIIDRRQKLLETISNIMKKMSQTKEAISGNTK